MKPARVLLSGDVGGTSSRLHLFAVPEPETPCDVAAQPRHVIKEAKYRNASFESFTDIVRSFLGDAALASPPLLACFGVAGVVVDNKARFVNLGWVIDGSQLMEEFGMESVMLINDFEAQGYGVLTLDQRKDCEVVQDAALVHGAPMAVVGAGTGLGEAFLTMSENGDYDVWPSEGGHADFAPRQEGTASLQFEMLQYLQIKYSAKARVSVERVVSGKGIANIYEFLAWKFPEQKNKVVHDRFIGGPDSFNLFDPAVVLQAALSGECELCTKALDFFVGAYGAEAGVAALKFMPYGGLYLTGGVTSKSKEFILGREGTPHAFMEAFLDKGRVSPMLRQIPIFLVTEEDMGERGVRFRAARLYQEFAKARKKSKGHMSLARPSPN